MFNPPPPIPSSGLLSPPLIPRIQLHCCCFSFLFFFFYTSLKKAVSYSLVLYFCALVWVELTYTDYLIMLNCCIVLLIALYLLSLVHGVQPDMTRDGCSIPVTLALQSALQKNIVLLPIGACDDGAHSQNEKINIVNYVQGVSFTRLLLRKNCSTMLTHVGSHKGEIVSRHIS